MLTTAYAYDRDGRVSSMTAPNDSTGGPAWQMMLNSGPDGSSASGAQETVYKSVSVNGATYGYFYDAFNRRRAKVYPVAGVRDEFYYQVDSALMADIGNDSVVTPTAHPIDEYIWLGGRPVALVRGKLDASFARQSDANGSDCTRNGSAQACGVFAVITDHIGMPVLMMDDQRRVVGEASIDPFGHMNRVTVQSGTAQPYANGANQLLADFRQPTWAPGTTVRIRVNLGFVDTESDGSTVLDGVSLEDGDTQVVLTSSLVGGAHAGRMNTPWITPSAGRVKTRFISNSSNCCPVPGGGLDCSGACAQAPNYPYSGVAMIGYEYQRYQSGAQPFWIPLRFPGQYYDVETDLVQNWNRFYEPTTGRYMASEPVLGSSVFVTNGATGPRRTATMEMLMGALSRGQAVSVYTYAGSNPNSSTDRTGLWHVCPNSPEAYVCEMNGRCYCRDPGDGEKWPGPSPWDPPPPSAGRADDSGDSGAVGGGRGSSDCGSCVCYTKGRGPNALGDTNWDPSAGPTGRRHTRATCQAACGNLGYDGFKCTGDKAPTWCD